MKLASTVMMLATLASCSNETEDSSTVDQSRIYQLYSAAFDADKNAYTWTAIFTLGGPGGTTLKLVDGSLATVNDQNMNALTTAVSGTFYIREWTGAFASGKSLFYWKDGSGKEYRNSIEIFPADLPEDLSNLSLLESRSLTWVGPATKSNEHVEVMIVAKGGEQVAVIKTRNAEETSITWTPEDLKNLTKGDGYIQLRRYSHWQDCSEATDVGGGIQYIYYSKKRLISLQ